MVWVLIRSALGKYIICFFCGENKKNISFFSMVKSALCAMALSCYAIQGFLNNVFFFHKENM